MTSGAEVLADNISLTWKNPPDLTLVSATNNETQGNGDGQINPGETIQTWVTLNNGGQGAATGVTAELSATDPNLTFVKSTVTFDEIPAGSEVSNENDPFVLSISPTTPSNTTIPVTLTINSNKTCYSTTLNFDINVVDVTGIAQSPTTPLRFSLATLPNPAHGATTISYTVPSSSRIDLAVYNTSGEKVKLLAAGFVIAGQKSIVWDGRDDTGMKMNAGVYFVKLEAGSNHSVSKLVFLTK